MLVSEIHNMLEPLKSQISTLHRENELLQNELDNLEIYSRRDCIRISGVSEDKENTDEAVLDIADKLSIPLKQSDSRCPKGRANILKKTKADHSENKKITT